jgi:hypothetical protein
LPSRFVVSSSLKGIFSLLTIRSKQIAAFAQAALGRFENEMIEHLETFAPQHCEDIGRHNVRKVIRLGIESSMKYGLTMHGPVQFYIELMFIFGSYFDNDPQLPWMKWIRECPPSPYQLEKADFLYHRAINYIEQVMGPENSYKLEALGRILDTIKHEVSFTYKTSSDNLLSSLKEIYPQKYEYIGDMAMSDLIRHGNQISVKYDLEPYRWGAFFTLLMLIMGHGFTNDSLFPCVSGVLNDQDISASVQRADRLKSKIIDFLEESLNSAYGT